LSDYESDNTAPVIDRASVTVPERGSGQQQPQPELNDDSPEAGIEALRRQIAEGEERVRRAEDARARERDARQEAERRARDYQQEVDTSRRGAAEAQYDSIINALHAAQGELSGAKQALKNAMSDGDFDKVADLSAEIGLLAARVRQFEDGKTALEMQRQNGGGQSQPRQGGDDRENYIQSRTPRTAAWLRKNDRFFSDRNFQQVVQGAHAIAVGRGIEPDSDEYFQFIDEQAGLRASGGAAGANGGSASAAGSTAPRQSPMPSAPAAGTALSTARQQVAAGSISLTPEERELCRRDGISEANYAKHKAALINEGRIMVGH